MSIEEIRKMVDALDDQMRELFEQRMDCIKAIAEYKYRNSDEIFDPGREKIVLEKNLQRLNNKEYAAAYERFLQQLMDSSKVYQTQWIGEQETKEQVNQA